MAITSAGVGSGLDINGIISQLMAVESRPLSQIKAKEAKEQQKLSAYGQVKSALSTFQNSVKALQDNTKFSGTKASVSEKDFLTASAGSTAQAGTYSVEVIDLAQSHKLASGSFSNSKTALATNGKNLTIEVGTKKLELSFDADLTLEELRDKINKEKAGVTANVVNDGTGYRLTLSATDTGAANTIKVSSTSSSSDLDKLLYAGGGGAPSASNAGQTQTAQDARVRIDGLTVTDSSNTLTKAIDGVTLTLTKKTEATKPITVTVTKDTGSAKSLIEGISKSYNDLMKTLDSLTYFKADTAKAGQLADAGILNGDSSIRFIRSQLRASFSTQISGISGDYALPASVGVGFDAKTGNMTIDSTKLTKALEADPQAVMKLFTASGKAADTGLNLVTANNKTKAGDYEVVLTDAPWVLQGSAAAGGGVGAAAFAGESMVMKVNGVAATIDLGAAFSGTNSSTTDVVNTLQSALNTAFGSNVVSVSHNGSKFEFTAAKQNKDSRVEVTSIGSSAATYFGLSNGSISPAKVAGTIGGIEALGDGITLTGSAGKDTEGLKIEITGGALGSRGTMTVTKGFGFAIDDAIESMVKKGGLLDSRTESINSTIKTLGREQDAFQTRLDQTETRLRNQFSRLDSTLSQMQQMSTYMQQQLTMLLR